MYENKRKNIYAFIMAIKQKVLRFCLFNSNHFIMEKNIEKTSGSSRLTKKDIYYELTIMKGL